MKDIRMYAFADEASPQVDGQLRAMLRNRLQGLEARNVDGVNISALSQEGARQLADRLRENGLRIWSLGSPIGKIHIENDDFSAHVEKFKHTLELATLLEAENIRLFSFYLPADKDPAAYTGEVIDRMGTLAELARGSGVTLCHENEKGIYGDTGARCLELMRAVPELKSVFDPANFIQCGEDTLSCWQLLAPYVKYLHIKDALPDGTVVPAGAGAGHIREIVAAFYQNGGRDVTLEPHLRVFDGLQALEREGEQSKVGERYVYADNDEAFDAACAALQKILRGDE